MHVHWFPIDNSQEMKRTYMSANWWPANKNVVYLHSGILFLYLEKWNYKNSQINSGSYPLEGGNPDPENQVSHVVSHLRMSALNLQICMFHLEYWEVRNLLKGRGKGLSWEKREWIGINDWRIIMKQEWLIWDGWEEGGIEITSIKDFWKVVWKLIAVEAY